MNHAIYSITSSITLYVQVYTIYSVTCDTFATLLAFVAVLQQIYPLSEIAFMWGESADVSSIAIKNDDNVCVPIVFCHSRYTDTNRQECVSFICFSFIIAGTPNPHNPRSRQSQGVLDIMHHDTILLRQTASEKTSAEQETDQTNKSCSNSQHMRLR